MSEFRSRSAAVAVQTNVASPAASTSLVAANPARKALIISNTSTSILYVLLGTGTVTATTVQSFQLATLQHIVLEGFTGAAQGIHSASNGSVNITELL
jgi:hypothetical protein